ncbi:transposable element Tc1 transposase [Trichonephila clavipes]|nr:transposable element Tc1 transposase [Trichonephila clavipes]
MPCQGIRAHYEQLSEFGRSRIIELKEAVCGKSENRSSSRSDWNHTDRGHILFSDESRFQLCPDVHRGRVWRILGQRADPAFNIACHTGPQSGVIVWGAISFDGWTPCLSLEHTYITTQDNARKYTVRVAMNCLTACLKLPSSARSPDLSPFEPNFDMMGRRLHVTGNVHDLTRQLEKKLSRNTAGDHQGALLLNCTACDSLHPG